MNRVRNVLFLEKHEDVLLSDHGLLKENPRSGWKPGRFYLTTRRVLLFQPPTVAFQIPLDSIVSLALEKKAVIIRTKTVLSMGYRKPRPNPASGHNLGGLLKAWMAIDGVAHWKKKVYERSLLRISEDALHRIAEELDSDSRAILTYLWQNKHAGIEELAELVSAPTHSHVLRKIRDHINPVSEKLMGNAILSFEKVRFDPETGQKVLFCWWILGRREKREQNRVPFDIFDEGAYLTLIIELPGANAEDILFELDDGRLKVSASCECRTFHQVIDLPAEVKKVGVNSRFKNNILEIRLKKAQSATSRNA